MGKQEQRPSRGRRQSEEDSRVAAVPTAAVPRPIVVDRHRSYIFPNRIRELRAQRGFPKLLALASKLPEIPYIRLSKIERGEVVARADEIIRIAELLGVPPRDLLIDVDDPAFDIEDWSRPFRDGKSADEGEEEFAILLAAAMRARRARSADLTIAVIERDYGIPPVILSRIENAQKTFDRWNPATVNGICRLFDVDDERALRREVEQQYRQGLLNEFVGAVADPSVRLEKTRKRTAELLHEIEAAVAKVGQAAKADRVTSMPRGSRLRSAAARADAEAEQVRQIPVIGAPLPEGLIAPVETGLTVEAPRVAGPRSFGLRICRPTLGAGLPGNAIVIADPDAFPSSGGLAVLREDGNYRLLAITFDLNGAMVGRSINPSLEVSLDAIDPSDIAAVLSASFA